MQVKIDSPSIKNSYLSISKQEWIKITTVSLACFAFLNVQWGYTRLIAGTVSLLCGGITLLTEKRIQQHSSWFSTEKVSFQEMGFVWACLITIQLTAGKILFSLNKKAPIAQYIAQQIAQRNMRIIAIACLWAPIVEEFVFRGFVKERLEDAVHLFSRHIYTISNEMQKHIANIAQAIIFGAAHLSKRQSPLANVFVFSVTTFIGWGLGSKKNQDQSLISPILIHMAINTSVCLRLFCFGT